MTQARFLLYLIQKAGQNRKLLIWASLASGLMQALLLYAIKLSLEELSQDESISLRTFLIFGLALLALYKALSVAMDISSTIGRELVTSLELRITKSLSESSYLGVQTLSTPQVFEMLSGAKDIVNEACILLPVFISSTTMLFCALCFAMYISTVGLVTLIIVMGLAATLFFLSDQRFVLALFAYRKDNEKFQASLRDVLEGFTELKMNEKRRKGLFEKKIIPLRDKVIKGRKTADSFRVKNTVMYGILVYLPVAALLFILPKTGLATFEECIKITAITLFATIPLVGLLSFMPLAARASVIISGLSEFNRKLQGMKDQVVGPQEPLEEFKRISVKNAKFTYLNVSNGKSFVSSEQFSLKVDDFYINKGELVILRGGNGSGKTTFMRLISGLYPFDEGEVLIDDKDIETFGSNNWRAYFTTLFSDFHLFDGLYGLCDEAEDIKNAEKEIERFSLAHKVKIDKNGFFSTLKLSSGQRKRMALAMALLENRPILLFDEVAADFDQNFREFFYKSLLPSLKEEGRTLLVISHDERYFSIADRILTLEYGEFI